MNVHAELAADHRAATRGLRGFLTLILVLGLFTLMASGCGSKDQDVETDPTATDQASEPVETVDLDEDQPFGESTEGEGVDAEDVGAIEDAEPAILLQDIFFDFDKFDLSDDARSVITQNGRLLREHSQVRLLIEGHCDERGTVQYNLALGEKRANEVKGYLRDLGVNVTRIDVVSYGKERPFVLGHDEAAWAQNRRAHFVVR